MNSLLKTQDNNPNETYYCKLTECQIWMISFKHAKVKMRYIHITGSQSRFLYRASIRPK